MAEQNGSFIGSYGVMFLDERPKFACLELESDQTRRFGQEYALPKVATCSAVILSPSKKEIFYLHDPERDELVLPSISWGNKYIPPHHLLRRELRRKTGIRMPASHKVAPQDGRVPFDIETTPLVVDPVTMDTTKVGLDLRYAFLAQTVLESYDDPLVDKIEWVSINDHRVDALGRVGRKLGELHIADVSLW
jgi:hypothetical protein